MSLKVDGEISVDSDPCLVAWDDKVFIGAEDGFIWTFDANLTAGESWQAHAVQPFALAVSGDKVYSASNDGGIRKWTRDGTKVTELPSTGADVGVLKVYNNNLYAGDEGGNITVFEDDKEKAKYNVLEEVKDLLVSEPFLFTVRDLDVTVTEIKPAESNTRYVTKHSMPGRSPLGLTGSHLLLMSRDGTTLQLHSAAYNASFNKLHEVKVSNMIVTSMSVKGNSAWTGGWDGSVKRWEIVDNKLKAAGEIELGACINAIVASTPEIAYAVLAGGKIVKIKAT